MNKFLFVGNRKFVLEEMIKLNLDVKNKNIEDITIDDFDLVGYFSHPTIKGQMAV